MTVKLANAHGYTWHGLPPIMTRGGGAERYILRSWDQNESHHDKSYPARRWNFQQNTQDRNEVRIPDYIPNQLHSTYDYLPLQENEEGGDGKLFTSSCR